MSIATDMLATELSERLFDSRSKSFVVLTYKGSWHTIHLAAGDPIIDSENVLKRKAVKIHKGKDELPFTPAVRATWIAYDRTKNTVQFIWEETSGATRATGPDSVANCISM